MKAASELLEAYLNNVGAPDDSLLSLTMTACSSCRRYESLS
jgi:hypothetical protein